MNKKLLNTQIEALTPEHVAEIVEKTDVSECRKRDLKIKSSEVVYENGAGETIKVFAQKDGKFAIYTSWYTVESIEELKDIFDDFHKRMIDG